MKKTFWIAILLCIVCAFAACGEEQERERAEYTLSFYSEGALVETLTAEEGDEIVLKDVIAAPQKAADADNTYVFSGWTLGENGEKLETYTVTGDASFYAAFTPQPFPSYTVKFVDEWEGARTTVSEQTIKRGQKAQLPANTPSHEGYTFTGWSPAPDTAIEADTEFTAQYAVNEYRLFLHVLSDVKEQTLGYGAELPLGAPELPAFLTFGGWYADEAQTELFSGRKMPAGELHIYAKCELDMTDARLVHEGDFVYGSENLVRVEGLPAESGISYSYLWQDRSAQPAFSLKNAGTFELSVEITARYSVVESVRTLSETVHVEKKTLTGVVTGLPESAVYGEKLQPVLQCTGFAEGDGLTAEPVFEYLGAKQGDPLPAGRYTVTATLPEMQNYVLGDVTPAQLEVRKKALTAVVSAEDAVYGEALSPTLSFEGLLAGEDDSVVQRSGDVFRYEKDGVPYTKQRFSAGSYTVALRTGACTAENYFVSESTPCTVTVGKAPLTVTVSMSQKSYVYGELPVATVSHSAFAYGDETEEGVFGSTLFASMPSHEGRYYGTGEYTVSANLVKDPENYTVTAVSATFTVTPRPLELTLEEVTAVYGDDAVLPAPVLGALAEGDEEVGASVLRSVRILCEGKEYAAGERLPALEFEAGRHTLTMRAEANENYALTCKESAFTLSLRPFLVSSGKIEQGREREFTLSPAFEGADAERFAAEGELVLVNRDAGVHTCGGGELSSDFLWRTPLKITHEGREITRNFAVEYALDVTLALSDFTLTVPSEGLAFAYDGQEHRFPVAAALLEGDEGTPEYSYTVDGTPAEGVPALKDAGTYLVKCTVRAKNYRDGECSYTVEISRAQGTVDVSGIAKEYVYNGTQQTVSIEGISSNNTEDPSYTVSGNVFTTVAEGNALTVTVTLKEGRNYTGAQATFGIHVKKQTLERLPAGVALPAVAEQVNTVGKTLSDIALSDGRFVWKDGGAALKAGTHGYAAIFTADAENIEPFETEITFVTRKQVISVKVEGCEEDYRAGAAASSVTFARLTLTDEQGEPCMEELAGYIRFETESGGITLAVGGTYCVPWTLTVTENEYYTLGYGDSQGDSFHDECFFKWKSVELNGTLYTPEDALSRLAVGETAVVRYDTSFAETAVSERLYVGYAYHTVRSAATLLVPYGANDSGDTEQKQASTGYAAVSPKGYVTLTLPAGELIVYGKFIVNAFRVSNSNQSSNVKGDLYATLSIAQGAKVTVGEGGVFESMGFTCGEGEVIAKSGAQVYEPFSMPGWKGGTISTGIRGTVFPINQFTASSIIAKLHLQAGAGYSLRVAITASSQAQNGLIGFVGPTNALMNSSDGEIVKYVTEADGKVCFELMGNVSFGNIAISTMFGNASTAGLQIPIPGHFSFDVKSGEVTVPDRVALKLLPGAKLTVRQGAKFTVAQGGALYAYGDGNYTLSDVTKWQDGNLGTLKEYPNTYVRGCYRTAPALGYDAQTPAVVTVGGEFTVEGGGKVGVAFRGEEGARLTISSSAVLQNTVKEDMSVTGDISGLGTLMGNGGKFFTATFTCGTLGAGNYAYSGGAWSKQD